MKKFVLIMIALFSMSAFTYAQKYAYVDTEYILNNIPEYKDAQTILDDLSVKWQKEIEDKLAKIERLYKEYQSEAVLLPEDVKRKREDEIIAREKEVKELQKKYFGQEGMLFQKRQELVQPIQEKVFNAIEKISVTKNYDFVFDKAGSLSILFADPGLDISDDVLDEVGTVMQTVKRGDRQ
ncbi:MAG: OmpH family outer membrane protein [Bacteroidales bacterium]|nr:OmpH family outer membrane protein [Bacteroidales bacterium]MCF8344553.1 OmpH family outer membrane protein [Bacteroidales bacterium]MCF8352244.1 OmpH family outer membrane protein [Bacteroidales bacterium]MCF8374767.1 OmpH family outer membrane protein [Bacteroidales bacterium]MCF8399829.1 OmpH family outer membrane protein [Bacteroidales bacterium]